MYNNNFNIDFSHFTQFEVDTLSSSIIDNAVLSRVTKLEKERLWDLAEELYISIDSINSLSRNDLRLVCDSLFIYHNRYPFEEREGQTCLKIANYILSETRGVTYE